MNKLKFAALAAGLLLQSLAYPADAPSRQPGLGHFGSVSLNKDRLASGGLAASRDYSPLPDIADLHRQDCDPEDDCPRPSSPQM
jgi:hypothetical protein